MEWGHAFAWLARRGHSLAECLELTLAQLAALTAGHAAVESAEEARLIAAIRLATAGTPAEVQAWLKRRGGSDTGPDADRGRARPDGDLHCL